MNYHPNAVIYGISGDKLTDEERRFFADANVFGFILFSRNIKCVTQLKALCDDLSQFCNHSTEPVILIDQEGGRVQRLLPPLAHKFPPARHFSKLYDSNKDEAINSLSLASRLMGAELAAYGIRVDCAPVCDILYRQTHDVIGDRAFGENAEKVSILARTQALGLAAAGVWPVIKHIPGHGRGCADSHLHLPIVNSYKGRLEKTCFSAFKELCDMPFAMTAHILYSRLDTEYPATLSPHIIQNIIRGEIGFKGLLMTDDLSMKALKGDFSERVSLSLQAGCDLILHCNGDMAEMQAIQKHVVKMRDDSLIAWGLARKWLHERQESLDIAELKTQWMLASNFYK
jgi:beta-N-acetylhexosaminidase